MSDSDVTEEQRRQAEQLLTRYYNQWVDQTALSIAEEVLQDEDMDGDAIYERIRETCDSALVYTSDQHLVLLASNSVSDAEDMLRDMGGAGDSGPAAVLAFTADVELQARQLGLDPADRFDRAEWLVQVANGDHGDQLVEAANRILLKQVKELVAGDSELGVLWDEHLEAGGSAADFLDEHG